MLKKKKLKKQEKNMNNIIIMIYILNFLAVIGATHDHI